MPNEKTQTLSLVDAFDLLTGHASGQVLERTHEEAMIVALWAAMSGDRLVRQFANVPDEQNLTASLIHPATDLCIEDVIQSILDRIRQREWPRIGQGEGLVHTMNSSILSKEFRNRLLDAYRWSSRRAGRPAKPSKGRHGQQVIRVQDDATRSLATDGDFEPPEDPEQLATLQRKVAAGAKPAEDEPEDEHQTASAFRTMPFGLDAGDDEESTPEEGIYGPEWEGRWSMAQFEQRCLLAAKKLVPTLKPRFAHIIDKLAAPFYLDEVDIKLLDDDLIVAERLGLTATTFCRSLVRLGLNLPRTADSPEKAAPLALETPIGRYLLQGCGLSELDRRDSEKEWAAMYTLCICNSEHLQALKS